MKFIALGGWNTAIGWIAVVISITTLLVCLWQIRKKTKLHKFKCGHESPFVKMVEIFGVKQEARTDKNHDDYCPDCLAAMSIKCAWCGSTIRVGDPITLYMGKPGYKKPDHAVTYGKAPKGYSHPPMVGCLGWECAETGADRAGFWVPPGKVQRVATVFEMLMANKGSDPIVIINDLSDPRNAVSINDSEEPIEVEIDVDDDK